MTKKAHGKVSRSQTEAAGNLLWITQSTAFLRRRFALIVKTTLVIIRLKTHVAKKYKPKGSEEEEESPPSPPPTPIVVRCDRCNRVHDPSDVPDVVRALHPPF